jgi:hypothetical protein
MQQICYKLQAADQMQSSLARSQLGGRESINIILVIAEIRNESINQVLLQIS